MSYGKKNEQIAVDAAINTGKFKWSFTATQIADFSDEYLQGETIPTGTIVYDSDNSKFQYYNGSAWADVFDNADLTATVRALLADHDRDLKLEDYATATAATADTTAKALVGAVAYQVDRKLPIVSDGANWKKPDDYIRLSAFWSQDTVIPVSQSDLQMITLIAPCAGRVRSCKAAALVCTDTVSLMFNNVDFSGGAKDLLSAQLDMTNASEGTVRTGALSSTAADLVVAANDRIDVLVTTSDPGGINDLTVLVEIEPSTGITTTDA